MSRTHGSSRREARPAWRVGGRDGVEHGGRLAHASRERRLRGLASGGKPLVAVLGGEIEASVPQRSEVRHVAYAGSATESMAGYPYGEFISRHGGWRQGLMSASVQDRGEPGRHVRVEGNGLDQLVPWRSEVTRQKRIEPRDAQPCGRLRRQAGLLGQETQDRHFPEDGVGKGRDVQKVLRVLESEALRLRAAGHADRCTEFRGEMLHSAFTPASRMTRAHCIAWPLIQLANSSGELPKGSSPCCLIC